MLIKRTEDKLQAKIAPLESESDGHRRRTPCKKNQPRCWFHVKDRAHTNMEMASALDEFRMFDVRDFRLSKSTREESPTNRLLIVNP